MSIQYVQYTYLVLGSIIVVQIFHELNQFGCVFIVTRLGPEMPRINNLQHNDVREYCCIVEVDVQ
jgi:type III secretory pathway component EscU